MSTLGNRIKNVRGDKTQKEFAALIGVSRDVLANWEVGRARPSTSDVVVIATAANVSTDYLLGRVDNQAGAIAVTTVPPSNTGGANDPVTDKIVDNLHHMSPEEKEAFLRLSQSVANRTARGVS